MKEKDKRVKQVSEMLGSIKVIKMFAWEKPLADRIAQDRSREVERLKSYGYLSSLQSIFWNSAPVTVSMATFGAYAALGNTLDMHVVLPALAIINIMSFPLFVLPLLISAVISGRVAMARLNDFLNLPERDTSHITVTPPGAAEPITLRNVTVGRNASRPIVSPMPTAVADLEKASLDHTFALALRPNLPRRAQGEGHLLMRELRRRPLPRLDLSEPMPGAWHGAHL